MDTLVAPATTASATPEKPHRWFLALVIAIVLAGCAVRLTNLGNKFYWADECSTSVWACGYPISDVRKVYSDGHVFKAQDLERFQHVNPDRNWTHTISYLVPDAKHPPGYFVLAHWWARLVGSDPAHMRLLSALLSLLAFPAIYWLCFELFGSTMVAALSMVLVAVSPLDFMWAQEARAYSLWTVFILTFCASLERAMRRRKLFDWMICCSALVLSFYTHLLSLLVGFSQTLQAVITAGGSRIRAASQCLSVLCLAVFAFSPWLFVLQANLSSTLKSWHWVERKVSLDHLFNRWTQQCSLLFCDFNLSLDNPLDIILRSLVVVLELYAVYFLWRRGERKAFWFVISLILSTSTPLLFQDLIHGGVRSLNPRYLIPCWIGIQLAVSYLLACQITATNWIKRTVWSVIAGALILAGGASCIRSCQSAVWWNKFDGPEALRVAEQVNRVDSPLLLCSKSFAISPGRFLSLARLLGPNVSLAVVSDPEAMKAADGFNHVFLLHMPGSVIACFRGPANFTLEQDAELGDQLWIAERCPRP